MAQTAPNPYVRHLLTILRDRTTNTEGFQKATERISNWLAFEASGCLHESAFSPVEIETPCGPHTGVKLNRGPVLVPVLRSGLALLATFQGYFQGSSVGFVGIKRNEETALPVVYYLNFPPLSEEDHVVILEPMLATGGTILQTIDFLIRRGVLADHIVVCTVICATAGVERIGRHYPDVTIVSAAIDATLNEHKYIVPGLGDFGDRFFGNEATPFFEEMKTTPTPPSSVGIEDDD